MMAKSSVLFIAFVLATVTCFVWWGRGTKNVSLDKGLRIDSKTETTEINIPKIGPFQARGFGYPADPNWVPIEFIHEPKLPSGQIVRVTGQFEVRGGDSAPLTIRCAIYKSGVTDLRAFQEIGTVNTTADAFKRKELSRSTDFSVGLRLPAEPGPYVLRVMDPKFEAVYAEVVIEIN